MLIFPVLPLLMKRLDLRLLVSVGCAIFALSCFMNSDMSYNTAGDQLRFSNIVRAFGQPFTIVPVTTIAITMLSQREAGDGSAIFNIFRNVGGSAGIAILATLVTRREQFHDWRIGERVTAYDLPLQARLSAVQARFATEGADSVTALGQGYRAINGIVQREAFIMAFNDAFLVIGVGLLAAAVLIWFCKKAHAKPGVAAH
jgi:DHA2 family multidrug resistance protein